MYKNILLSCLVALFLMASAHADTVKLRADHPERHIVVKGDTLWDISGIFLEDPWLWPKIWKVNPQIDNPHLIYPGDIIYLVYVDGKPVLMMDRDPGILKLSPRARISKLEQVIPTIPLDVIRQFMTYPRVVSEDELEHAGYIIAGEEGRLFSGTGNMIYVRHLGNFGDNSFSIYHQGRTYKDPKTNEVLGIEAVHVGDSTIERPGDPTELVVTDAKREIQIGDHLLPIEVDREIRLNFIPHAPAPGTRAQIISVLDAGTLIGQYHTVVINLGLRDGMEPGHVLSVYQAGDMVRDTKSKKWFDSVRLPERLAGTLMVILPYEKISYALVMDATKDIRVLDSVTTPK